MSYKSLQKVIAEFDYDAYKYTRQDAIEHGYKTLFEYLEYILNTYEEIYAKTEEETEEIEEIQTPKLYYSYDKNNKEVYENDNVVTLAKGSTYLQNGKPTSTKKYAKVSLKVKKKKWINKLLKQSNDHIYERIFQENKRKLYIDFDKKLNRPSKYTIHKTIKTTHKFINHIYRKITGKQIDYNKIQVCYVVDTTTKMSFHVTYPIYFKNHDEMKIFIDYMFYVLQRSDTPKRYIDVLCDEEFDGKPYIDDAVYKTGQLFRCLYQSKEDKEHHKVLVPYADSSIYPTDHFIGLYGDKTEIDAYEYFDVSLVRLAVRLAIEKLIEVCKTKEAKKRAKKVNKYAKYPTNEIKPIMIERNLWRFYLSSIPNNNRKSQTTWLWRRVGYALWSLTKLTGEDYYNDFLDWSNKANQIWTNEAVKCRELFDKCDSDKWTPSWGCANFLRTTAIHYNGKHKINKRDIDVKFSDIYNPNIPFDYWEVKQKYCGGLLTYEEIENGIVILESAMGTGKTHEILRYIEIYKPKRVLVVGCRRAFCNEKQADFEKVIEGLYGTTGEKMVSYLDKSFNKKQPSKHNNLVIQYESLHYLKEHLKNDAYDLVVLDEIEAIGCTATSETNGGNLTTNLNTLIRLVKNSKFCVMADAFISSRTIGLVESINEASIYKKKIVKMIKNTYTPEHKLKARFIAIKKHHKDKTEPKSLMLDRLLEDVKNNKRICVYTASKEYALDIQNRLKEQYLNNGLTETEINKLLKCYTSSSGDRQLKSEMQNIDEVWSEAQVIIYTSKITVGVNFSIPNIFDTKYIYSSACGGLVRDVIQSHYRVRHIKDTEIYVYVNDVHMPSIEKESMTKKTFEDLTKCYDEEFEMNVLKRSYEKLRETNDYERRISKEHHVDSLSYFLKKCSYDVIIEGESKTDEIDDIDEEHTEHMGQSEHTDNMGQSEATENIYNEVIDLLTNTEKLHGILDRVKSGDATETDKELERAYFMYVKFLRKSDFMEGDDEERQSDFMECMTEYNGCLIDKLDNAKFEILDGYKTEAERYVMRWQSETPKSRNRVLMYGWVKELKGILGLNKSWDCTTITEDMLIKVAEWYMGHHRKRELTLLNNIRIGSDKTKLKMIGKNVADTIIWEWCGNRLKSEVKNARRQGKVVKEYTYKTIEDEKQTTLMGFVRTIEYPISIKGYAIIDE
jgi:hypothetical protein